MYTSLCDQIKNELDLNSIRFKRNGSKNTFYVTICVKSSDHTFLSLLEKSCAQMPCRRITKVKRKILSFTFIVFSKCGFCVFHLQKPRLKLELCFVQNFEMMPYCLDYMRYNCKINKNTLSFIRQFILLFHRRRNIQFTTTKATSIAILHKWML